MFVSSLGKSWIESGVISLFVFDPVKGVWCGGIGLTTPLNLIRLIVLGIVPSMVSLGVWGDVGSAVSNWVDHPSFLSKNRRGCGNFSSIGFDFFIGSFCRIEIVGTNGSNMGFPFSFISLIGLITAPSIICMVISSNHGLSIMVLNMFSLGKSWIES